jgi:rare lipoprotein A (peptidoglycan hydrolase)
MKKSITLFFLFVTVIFANAQNQISEKQKVSVSKNNLPKQELQKTVIKESTTPKIAGQKVSLSKDTVRKSLPLVIKQDIVKDTIPDEVIGRLKLYKKSVHASYYADKFNGRRTTSGIVFNNNDYTAAHKKFPFGTKLKITNEANGKSVIVDVIDRGPFVKSREIDLTKKAFMEIAKNKSVGVMTVTIEEVVPE